MPITFNYDETLKEVREIYNKWVTVSELVESNNVEDIDKVLTMLDGFKNL